MSEQHTDTNPGVIPPAPPPYGQAGVANPSPSATFQDPRRKTPFLASFLSIMPGLGQVYVGYYQRGFVHAIVVASLIAAMAGSAGQTDSDLWPFLPLLGLFLAFFWLYNIVDAGRRATLYNEALAGGSEIEMPKDFQSLSIGGSLFGGICIGAIGFILLLRTRFNVSLDWVAEWWPAALVMLGAFLVYKAIKERQATATSDDEI